MLRKVSKNAIIPFLTLMLPFVVIRLLLLLRDVSGGKAAPSMELARLTLDGVTCHDLVLGGGVCATKHFWYWT